MRSQGCTIQQALTAEATTIVKQAVCLAKRRGHAQVTPLHVAHTMLSVTTGLLRAACIQAHAHPFQCRALELCFNVALNRLPSTSTSGPMLGPRSAQTHYPTIANALGAAFKRAQAHQRRGSIENQQQPLLAVKVEVEQLIISILDDPSVSRVMREAGFSSTLVKEKIEQVISQNSNNSNNNSNNNNNNNSSNNNDINSNNNKNISGNNNNKFEVKDCNNFDQNYNNNEGDNSSCDNIFSMGQPGFGNTLGKPRLLSNYNQGGVRNEDVMRVIESLVMNKRNRNRVIVGECIATLESVVKELMNRVEKGDVPGVLKEVIFVQLSFSSFGHLSREEVEQRIGEIECLVKSCCLDNKDDNNKGLVLYFDDLKWANEFRASSSNSIHVDQYQPIRRNYYCPIEHMIMEIGKLVLNFVECGKLWLLGIATFQTYMRTQSGNPPIETLWGLHAVTIPVDSLGLSLILDRDIRSSLTNKKTEVAESPWLMLNGGHGDDDNNKSRQSPCSTETSNSNLPLWLQQYKEENNKKTCNTNDNQDYLPVKDVCTRLGTPSTSSMHIFPTITSVASFERSPSFSSISPSSTTSNFSHDPLKLQQTYQSFDSKNVLINNQESQSHEPTFTISIQDGDNNDHPHRRHTNMFISSSPNSTPTSTSSSEVSEPIDQSTCVSKRFKEYNVDNLRTLCNALERKLPQQKDTIFDIVSTILQCRSSSSRRKVAEQGEVKEDTWLFFQGFDVEAKESIARELSRLIFGSQDKFVSICLSNFSSTKDGYSSEDTRNKRLRDEHNCMFIGRFVEAVSQDPHRVFFIEDVNQVDYYSQMGIKTAMERGKILNHNSGEEVSFNDAIIILSCERFSSKSRASSPSTKQKLDVLPQQENQMIRSKGESEVLIISPSVSLDLNISINDEDKEVVKYRSIDEIGLLASVDRCIVFKDRQELS